MVKENLIHSYSQQLTQHRNEERDLSSSICILSTQNYYMLSSPYIHAESSYSYHVSQMKQLHKFKNVIQHPVGKSKCGNVYILIPSFLSGDNIPGECLLLKIAGHDNASKEEITREDHSTAAPPPATL